MGGKNPFRNPRAARPEGVQPAQASSAVAPAVRWGWILVTVGLLVLAAVASALGYWQRFERQQAALQSELALRLMRRNAELLRARLRVEDERDQARNQQRKSSSEATQLEAKLRRLEEEHRSVTEAHRLLENQMRTALESRDVTISELAGKLTVNILDRVLFASGEAEITPEGQEVLRKVAGVLGQFPNRQVQVIGHTDNVPIHTARFPSNWELSAARALAAVRFLTEQAGVDPHRLGALGYGEFHPIADNATPEGRARNRRIAIVVLPELLSTADESQLKPKPQAAPSDEPIKNPAEDEARPEDGSTESQAPPPGTTH